MVNINDRIGNYVLIEEINSGGFGIVYKARHHFLEDIIVAIKVLHPHLIAKQHLKQFFQEAQLLYKLKHRYILPILDVGIHDNSPYIIMEYAAQGSLDERIQKQHGKPLPLDEAVKILIQVGNALRHAHAQNVTHRDLKPDNILFGSNGDVLLADFGLAVVLASGRTHQVGVGGTSHYMAPEQFAGDVSMKSDLYALGCIAYEMLAGKRPFVVEYPTIERMWYQHAQVQPIAPRQYNPAIPEYIEQAILTAIAKDRKNRHADVATFMATLQALPKLKKTKEHWLDEGIIHNSDKRNEKALLALEQAILLDPSYAIAYRNKGFTLHQLKRYEEAIVAYEEAIKRDITYAISHNGKGNVLCDLKRYEEALLTYEEAIKCDPNFVFAHANKGNVLYVLKRYEEAIVANEEAIKRDATLAYPHNGKGNVLYDLKRYEEAIRAYEEAIKRDATFALPHNSKGLALRALGRSKEAEQSFARAKELGHTG